MNLRAWSIGSAFGLLMMGCGHAAVEGKPAASLTGANPVVTEASQKVGWGDGQWLNTPPKAQVEGADLVVTTGDKTDFWRRTSYGFVHDNGHALLTDFPNDSAVEVTYEAKFTSQFDQAGLLVRVDDRTWTKAGVEFSDGVPQLGSVVTKEFSDWSVAPSPDWVGVPITVRASRSGDAVTIRARRGSGPWQLVRVTPLAPDAVAKVGPFTCSPTRAGLVVRFTRFAKGPADKSLHGD